MNVIVLGANGQLGSDIVKEFTINNKNKNNDTNSNQCMNESCIIGLTRKDMNLDMYNITQDHLKKILTPYLSSDAPNYIINCIATTNVDACESESTLAFSINTSFAYQLAKFCNEYNAVLCHISTDYVLSGTSSIPYNEDAVPDPINIYGLSKYAGELAVTLCHDKSFIFRVAGLFGVAGASGKGGNFISTMRGLGGVGNSDKALDVITVIADQITCPTATHVIARAIHTFIHQGITDYGVYNCVSSNSCSWFEFAQEIFRLSCIDINKLHKAQFASYPFVAKRPQYTILNTSKISKYYKMPTWQESLVEYFNLLKESHHE
jgi:dTDP-4-dehydrorhamnose reductase